MMADANNHCQMLPQGGEAETCGQDDRPSLTNEHLQPHQVDQGYQVLAEIGRGAYGVVYKALDLENRTLVAIKEAKVTEGSGAAELMTEANILKKLQHQNIVNLKEICDCVSTVNGSDSYALVLEFAHCDFVTLLETYWEKLEVQHMKSLSQQFLMGLKYLHSKHLLHRDIKPENIMLTDDGTVKITDFGLSRFKSKNRTGDGRCYSPDVGTRVFQSPELLLGTTRYSSAVDMWAAGLTIYELFTRSSLFPVRNTVEGMLEEMALLLGTIDESTVSERIGLPDLDIYTLPQNPCNHLKMKLAMNLGCTAAMKLLCGLLRLNPHTRFSASTALSQHYFQCAPAPERFIIRNLPGYPRSPPNPPLQHQSPGHSAPQFGVDYPDVSSPEPVPDTINEATTHQSSPPVEAGRSAPPLGVDYLDASSPGPALDTINEATTHQSSPPVEAGRSAPPLGVDYLDASSPGPVLDTINEATIDQSSSTVEAGPRIHVEQIRPAPEQVLPSTSLGTVVLAEVNATACSSSSIQSSELQSAVAIEENTRRNRRRHPRAQPLRDANGRFHPYFSPN